MLLSPFDLKRLESYANNMIDYHVVMDLLPTISALYFGHRLGPDVKLNAVQSAIMLSLGLQRKSIEDVEVRCNIPYTNLSRHETYFIFCKSDTLGRTQAPRQPGVSSFRQSHPQDIQSFPGNPKSRSEC